MTADACGNIYIAQRSGLVWRVDPDGKTEVWLDLSGAVLTDINFGSGRGGWRRTATYVMSVGGTLGAGLFEAEIGLPGRLDAYLR